MASGDIFSDVLTAVGVGGVDIQPAAGVKVMITTMLANHAAIQLKGKNGGTTGPLIAATAGGTSAAIDAWQHGLNMKWFLTNADYIHVYATSGTHNFVYSGIEI